MGHHMCGLFGFLLPAQSRRDEKELRRWLGLLARRSSRRGMDATGLGVLSDGAVAVFKRPQPAARLIASPALQDFLFPRLTRRPLAIIGHCRLMTQGDRRIPRENQPLQRDEVILAHNGIVINQEELWTRLSPGRKQGAVDSEVLLATYVEGREADRGPGEILDDLFAALDGSASLAVLDGNAELLLLATNTGSLHTTTASDGTLLFASEPVFLDALLPEGERPRPLRSGRALQIALSDGRQTPFSLRPIRPTPLPPAPRPGITAAEEPSVPGLRRCTRCILPETMPFLGFDDEGVCDRCRDHRPFRPFGLEALLRRVAPQRSTDGSPDCIVGFSGGRDSSYGLHLAVKVLGLHPIAFTYDWGMVTDLARRNQARLCGRLGVEHVIVAADIDRKREHIRKNVEAWMRRPELGMVPLFMAGDKAFLYHGRRLQKERKLPLFLYCSGNPEEKTGFKTGFCGVRERPDMSIMPDLGPLDRLRLALYYAGAVARNPAYLNDSIWDGIAAFLATFALPRDQLFLYHYVPFDERDMVALLEREYGWESAPDTPTTWRIDDGSAPFYNHIYHSVAGFSEHDTFRSYQIRSGVLTRDEALASIRLENRPRRDALAWYADVIGLDLDRCLERIAAIPKLY